MSHLHASQVRGTVLLSACGLNAARHSRAAAAVGSLRGRHNPALAAPALAPAYHQNNSSTFIGCSIAPRRRVLQAACRPLACRPSSSIAQASGANASPPHLHLFPTPKSATMSGKGAKVRARGGPVVIPVQRRWLTATRPLCHAHHHRASRARVPRAPWPRVASTRARRTRRSPLLAPRVPACSSLWVVCTVCSRCGALAHGGDLAALQERKTAVAAGRQAAITGLAAVSTTQGCCSARCGPATATGSMSAARRPCADPLVGISCGSRPAAFGGCAACAQHQPRVVWRADPTADQQACPHPARNRTDACDGQRPCRCHRRCVHRGHPG